jgi:hypothetical protein
MTKPHQEIKVFLLLFRKTKEEVLFLENKDQTNSPSLFHRSRLGERPDG